MVDPLDTGALRVIQELHPDLRIKPILCEWRHFDTVLKKIYPSKGPLKSEDQARAPEPGPPNATDIDVEIPEVAAIEDDAAPIDVPPAPPDAKVAADLDVAPAGDAPARELVAELKRAVEELTESARMARMSRAAEGAALIDEVRESVAKLGRALSKELGERISEALAAASARSERIQTAQPEAGAEHAIVEFKRPAPAAEGLAESDAKLLRALEAGEMLGPFGFDDFFPGKTNEFALAAAKAVSDAPGGQYNPFFVYGEVGVGKTHLINAVANTIVVKHPGLRVGFMSAGRFAGQIEHPAPEHGLGEIRRDYARFDVLLVDDVQLLGEHPAAQNEFFHLFNALHLHRRQIIITADNPPERLGLLERRLAASSYR
jgi:chromosomal replication initiation ATPase DnaA